MNINQLGTGQYRAENTGLNFSNSQQSGDNASSGAPILPERGSTGSPIRYDDVARNSGILEHFSGALDNVRQFFGRGGASPTRQYDQTNSPLYHGVSNVQNPVFPTLQGQQSVGGWGGNQGNSGSFPVSWGSPGEFSPGSYSPGGFTGATQGGWGSSPETGEPGQRRTVILDDKEIPIKDGSNLTHGEFVEETFNSELEQNGIQGVNGEFVQIEHDESNQMPEDAEGMVNWMLNDPIQERTRAVEQLDSQGDIGAINISSGTSVAKVARQVMTLADEDPQVEAQFQDLLGVSGDVQSQEFKQALFDYIEDQTNTQEFQQTLNNFQQVASDARDNDTAVVVTSGNEQEVIDTIQSEGVDINDSAGLNFLASAPDVIVAGATDDQGTPSLHDDEAAIFSSRGEHVDFAANGMNAVTIDGETESGTSFTAPKVTAQIATIQQQHPDWSVDQVEEYMRNNAIDNPNIDPEVEGAGTINWQALQETPTAA